MSIGLKINIRIAELRRKIDRQEVDEYGRESYDEGFRDGILWMLEIANADLDSSFVSSISEYLQRVGAEENR